MISKSRVVTVLVAVLCSPLAWASHPVTPSVLKQEQNCGSPPCTPVAAGAFVGTTAIRLTATSDSGTCDTSTPTYQLEFEVRSTGASFTGTPTHSSSLMAKPSCVAAEYPFTVISNLSPDTYQWRVRERVGTSTSSWATFGGGGAAFIIGNPAPPEIIVEEVNLSNMVSGASTLDLTIAPSFRNWGQADATDFFWKAYLSTDKVKDGSDTLIYTSSIPFSVPAISIAADTANVTIDPKPGPGQYYVLVEADATNVVAEFDETNNLGSTLNYFSAGVDLVATSISGPAVSGPENDITVDVSFFNQGIDAAGLMEYKVWLSADTQVGPGDFELDVRSRTMTGGETVNNEALLITVPTTVPGGEFYYLLQLDSGAAITEVDENNNVVASTTKVKIENADLELDAVEFVDVVTHLPTRVGFFGQTGRMQVTFKNQGGADAKNFHIAVIISTDTTLSLLADTIAHDEPVALLAAGQSTTVSFDFPIPLKDRANKNFATGQYYVFVTLDSFNKVGELSEQNNSGAVAYPTPEAVTLRAPAQDYAVIRVSPPTQAAVGERIPVFRTIANVGNEPGMEVHYKYFASANEIVTTADVPLALIDATGTASEYGKLTLGAGAEDSATEWVQLPGSMSPGTYYIGVFVDFDGRLAELDEQNNAIPSPATVQVAPAALQVAGVLPDALRGVPYQAALSLIGAPGAVSWSIDTATGTLPEGLTLSAEGVVNGTPTVTGLSAFTVQAHRDGRVVAAARRVIRVLPVSGELQVTSTTLPPLLNQVGATYSSTLGAAGGAMPYSWKLFSGTLPSGLALDSSGTLSGTLSATTTSTTIPLVLQVTDAVGTVARASISLKLIPPGSLVLKSVSLPDGVVRSDYLIDLIAQNAGGGALSKPLVWTVASGVLPPGLALSSPDGERALLSGRPITAGYFGFTLQVEDARGQADLTDYLMRIHPSQLTVTAAGLAQTLRLGEEVNVQFTSTGQAGEVRFELYSGQLPPGLTLGADGTLTGSVLSEVTAVGVYNFVVAARDGQGGTGLGAFVVEVVSIPRGGCASATGGPTLLGLIALGLLRGWHRRRAGSTRR